MTMTVSLMTFVSLLSLACSARKINSPGDIAIPDEDGDGPVLADKQRSGTSSATGVMDKMEPILSEVQVGAARKLNSLGDLAIPEEDGEGPILADKQRSGTSAMGIMDKMEPILTEVEVDGAKTIRLVNTRTGGHWLEGRVEVKANKAWHKVCYNSFDDKAAAVACRQMGFLRGEREYVLDSLKGGVSSIWKNDFECSGGESHLLGCPLGSPSTCYFDVAAVVFCDTKRRSDDGDIRLADGYSKSGQRRVSSASAGILEIKVGGKWGYVEDYLFDDVDATVACKQLGYKTGKATEEFGYGGSGKRCLIERLACVGSEPDILSCVHEESYAREKSAIGVKCAK